MCDQKIFLKEKNDPSHNNRHQSDIAPLPVRMTTIPVMPFLPIRGDKYTPDEYIEDLLDGDLGLGAWRKGQDDNEYNVKIEYDRLTLDEKRVVIEKLEANPGALLRFQELEQKFNQYSAYYGSDSRDFESFLTGCVLMLESAATKAEDNQSSKPEIQFDYPERPNEICASLVPFVYPEYAAHCEKSLAVYARLPLDLHMSVYSDEDQRIPVTADVCGQSAFDSIYNSGRFANTQYSKTLAAYQSCEYTILDREQANRDYEELGQVLIDRLAALGVRIKLSDLPRSILMDAVSEGWHAGLISEIEIFGQICSLTFYDESSQETLLMGFSLPKDKDAPALAQNSSTYPSYWESMPIAY